MARDSDRLHLADVFTRAYAQEVLGVICDRANCSAAIPVIPWYIAAARVWWHSYYDKLLYSGDSESASRVPGNANFSEIVGDETVARLME